MFRLTRGLHTSRCQFQQVSHIEKHKQNVEAFLKYWKTPRDLRILMYREKHAQELLSRDLIDPLTDKRARPLPLPTIPSKHALGAYIQGVSGADNLQQLQDDITLLARKAGAVYPYHLNELLIKFAQYRRIQNFLVFLQSNKHVASTRQDNSVYNMILFYLLLNPNKSLANKISKSATAQKSCKVEPDAISNLLKCAFYTKAETPVPTELFEKVKEAKLELPFDELKKGPGHQAAFLTEYQHQFVFLKAISNELGTHEDFRALPLVKNIQDFVSQYEDALQKLDKPNRYEEIVETSKFYKASFNSDAESNAEAEDLSNETKEKEN